MCLLTDGLFWTEEADTWLSESGVVEIVLTAPHGELSATLTERVRALRSRGYQTISIAPPATR